MALSFATGRIRRLKYVCNHSTRCYTFYFNIRYYLFGILSGRIVFLYLWLFRLDFLLGFKVFSTISYFLIFLVAALVYMANWVILKISIREIKPIEIPSR